MATREDVLKVVSEYDWDFGNFKDENSGELCYWQDFRIDDYDEIEIFESGFTGIHGKGSCAVEIALNIANPNRCKFVFRYDYDIDREYYVDIGDYDAVIQLFKAEQNMTKPLVDLLWFYWETEKKILLKESDARKENK